MTEFRTKTKYVIKFILIFVFQWQSL